MAILIFLTITVFGILAYQKLPVSDLPSVDYPTIQVSVDYPGADPQTIANSVVVPLEQQFAAIEGIQVIASTSYTGSATISLQFSLNKNIDLAAPDVQAAINAATPQLPQDLPYTPTYHKVNPTASPILIYALTSETDTLSDLYDYGYSFLAERLGMVEGVSQALVYGTPFAVRLRIDPQQLAARSIGIDEVSKAIQLANVYLPTGTLYGKTREFTIDVDGQMTHAEQYNQVIIKNDNGSITRFSDIGEAIDSVQDDKLFFSIGQKGEPIKPSIAIAIQRQSDANTLDIISKVNELLPSLQKGLPASIQFVKIYDQAEYIRESVHDMQFTLLFALALVVIVVIIYLGKVRDTLIPIVAIPLSIIGSFILMFYLNFSIDILSLLAFTLVIGFLVDDAIVVLENIVRHIESGKTPLQAALAGSKEIGVTVVSMTLCLATVFIPLLFMGGIIGKVLHSFSFIIIIAVLFSGFISLALTPLLCSKFLKPTEPVALRKTHFLERLSERFNQKILQLYSPSLDWALAHRKTMLSVGIASLSLSLLCFNLLPKDFLPDEDMGLIKCFLKTSNGTSPFQTKELTETITNIIKEDPNVDSVAAFGGYPQDNEGFLYIHLKPLSQRLPLDKVLHTLSPRLNALPGVQVYLKPLPMINLQSGAVESKANYQYTLQSFSPDLLYEHTPLFEQQLRTLSTIQDVVSDLDISQPQLRLHILRDIASTYNITAFDIENVLGLCFANTNLSPINTPHNQYYAILETLPKFYQDPDKLQQLWLHSPQGERVPLSAVTTMTESVGPLKINHLNGLPSATISFNLHNAPLETALAQVEKIANEVLPPSIQASVQGSANVFRDSFASLNFLVLIMLFLLYVILGILYESFFPPITVMSALPTALLGGFLGLIICNESFSLYAFVGLILLLGIVLKNGIILIDFANETRTQEGKSIHDAIHHASLVRVRPILMTTFAAMMGAVPIAIGLGGMTTQGRRPLGIVIVCGLLFSQIITLYLTPVLYTYIEELRSKIRTRQGSR